MVSLSLRPLTVRVREPIRYLEYQMLHDPSRLSPLPTQSDKGQLLLSVLSCRESQNNISSLPTPLCPGREAGLEDLVIM